MAAVNSRRRAVIIALVVLAGCTDNPGSPCSLDCQSPEGVIVSNAVAPGALTAEAGGALALAPGAADDVAYVSLAPGTVPAGSRASVRRVGDAASVTTAVTGGGFDPVPVIAQAGDLIEVTVTDVDRAVVLQRSVLVAAARRPIIVRTDPPPRKRDVPLNASLVIVFSEPIDGATLTPASVRLLRGGTVVAGSVHLLDVAQVKAAFVPDAPLAAQADYQLVVSQTVSDRDGQPLAAAVTVPFTAGSSLTGPPALISFSVDTGMALVVGATFPMTATVRDAAGNELTDQPVSWFTTDSGVLTVSATGLLTAVGDGYAYVGASVGGVSHQTSFLVTALPAASLTVAPATTTVGAGDTVMVTATVRDAAERIINHPSVTWTSSASAVATVATAGPNQRIATVTAESPGSVTITASSGAISASAEVTVGPRVPVASVTVSPSAPSVVVQETVQLAAILRDANGKVLFTRPTTWTSDNTAVATVDANGLVTAAGAGLATITATSEGVSGTATITATTITFGSLSANPLTSCGLTLGGAAYCWGFGDYGQLGNGSTSSSPFPVAVSGGHTFTLLTGGVWSTCGLLASGAAYCWGDNRFGQLGNGSTVSSLVPVPVTGGLSFTTLSGGYGHTCGLTASGIAYCWGNDGYATSGSIPVPVAGGLRFTSIAGGGETTCGLIAGGAAYCWGSNFSGQLGDGSTTSSSVPVAVFGGLSFTSVSPNYYDTCGLATSGAAYCWGGNSWGQLGDGSTTASPIPVPVTVGTTFTSVSAGDRHTCGLSTSGGAYCWGDDSYGGQLGNGLGVSSLVPVPVTGGLSFGAVKSGGLHTCGLTTGGVAYCWGSNEYGQVGDGSTTNRFVPVKVAGQP